jgi:hypothetical protein
MSETLEFVIKGKDEFTGIMNNMLGKLGTLGVAAGAVVGAVAGLGAGLVFMTKRVADAHDELGKFAGIIGVSTESLSSLRYAAELSNIDIGTFNTSLRFMSKNLSEAAHGGGPAAEALRNLGISVSQLAGMSADKQLMVLADAMEGLTSQSDKVRVAFALFGRGGVPMLQMLGEGREKIEAMRKEAERFGIVVSQQAAANADEFGDSLTRMDKALEGVRNAIAEKVMPILTTLFNKFAFWLADNRDKFADWGLFLVRTFIMIYEVGQRTFNGIKDLINEVVDGFTNWIKETDRLNEELDGAFGEDPQWLKNFRKAMGTWVEETDDAVEATEDKFKGIDWYEGVGESVDKIIEKFRQLGSGTARVGQEISDNQAQLVIQLEDIWTKWLGNSKEALTDFSTELSKITASIWQSFSKGVADSFAQMIVYGESLHDAFRGLGKQILAQMVSMLIQMGINYIALSVLKLMLGIKEMGTRMASLSAETYGAAFASTAAIPIIGPALAPGVATASVATMLAGATASGTAGSAVGMAIAGAAHGGLTDVPREETYLLQRGERVVSPDQNRDLKEFMAAGGGGRSIVIEAIQIINPMGTSQDWDRIAAEKIVPAINRQLRRGLTLEVA